MGDFDFGQFQQIFEYLSNKLKEGGALTPEEQQVYDQLIGFSNQGLNLTNTADFNSLYNAFNSLADEGTKKQFEQLYGTNFTQDPGGQIHFTRPGSVIEQFMRRGQSVNDGPAMAALSEGLQGYLKQIAQNKFAAMTNSYAAMTPIRQQNIQAATNAGALASTAIGRRVPIAGVAVQGARGAPAGAGDVGGEGVSIDTTGGPNGPNGPKAPGFFDKFGPSLIGLLGTGILGAGGYLLKDLLSKKSTTPEGDVLGEGPLGNTDRNPYTGQALTSPYEMSSQNPDAAMSLYNPNMMNPYGNAGIPQSYPSMPGFNQPVDQYWNQPQQQDQGYNFNVYNQPQQTPSYQDWSQGSSNGGWDFGMPPDQTIYPDVGGGGDWGGSSAPVDDYWNQPQDTSSWYPSNDDYGSGWY